MEKPFALIVEDNLDIVSLFQHVLDMAGYHTEIVMDGREAMVRIAALPPDIVLLDLQLPGMSGVDILKQMRASETLSGIPVVVITAYPNVSSSLPFQPDLLLMKPVDINELSSLVQRLKSTHGARRGLAHDPVTGLYNLTAFKTRLESTLERVRRSGLLRFGVLFADILNLDLVRFRSDPRQVNAFLRMLANGFKTTVRPTDTTAWFTDQGFFLALIEEIPNPEACLKIVERVQVEMNGHLSRHPDEPILRSVSGMLICDTEYKNVDTVLRDLTLRRESLRNGETPAPAVFDHNTVLTQK
jgi:PleD family two-component response regulator